MARPHRLRLNGTEVIGSSENNRFRSCVDGVNTETVWINNANNAVFKYLGKASVEWKTPTISSVNLTLGQSDLRAVTTVAASARFTQDRLWLNGTEVIGSSENKRFRACVD